MSDKFKDFQKGLLNKDPQRRLNWPNQLHHPFQKESDEEERDRKKRSERYKQWIGLNFVKVVEEGEDIPFEETILDNIEEFKEVETKSKVADPLKFEDFSDVKGNDTNVDQIWKQWLSEAQDPKQAGMLRKNTQFLESLLKNLQMNMEDILGLSLIHI